MSIFSLHIGTMTCDYDNDHLHQELKFQPSVEAVIVNGHSQQVIGTMTCDDDNDHLHQELKFQHFCENGHSHSQQS